MARLSARAFLAAFVGTLVASAAHADPTPADVPLVHLVVTRADDVRVEIRRRGETEWETLCPPGGEPCKADVPPEPFAEYLAKNDSRALWFAVRGRAGETSHVDVSLADGTPLIVAGGAGILVGLTLAIVGGIRAAAASPILSLSIGAGCDSHDAAADDRCRREKSARYDDEQDRKAEGETQGKALAIAGGIVAAAGIVLVVVGVLRKPSAKTQHSLGLGSRGLSLMF